MWPSASGRGAPAATRSRPSGPPWSSASRAASPTWSASRWGCWPSWPRRCSRGAESVPRAHDLGGDADDPRQITLAVEIGHLDSEEGSLAATHLHDLLAIAGHLVPEYAQVALPEYRVGLRREDFRVSAAGHPAAIHSRHFMGEAVGEQVATFQVFDEDRYRGGVERQRDLCLQVALADSLGGLPCSAAQGGLGGDQQLVGQERFQQVAVEAEFGRPLDDRRVLCPGDGDDGEVGMFGQQVLDQGEPRLSGHLEVAEDGVEGIRRQSLPGGVDVRHGLAPEPLAEDQFHFLQDVWVMIDREDCDIGLRHLRGNRNRDGFLKYLRLSDGKTRSSPCKERNCGSAMIRLLEDCADPQRACKWACSVV